ncbi:hypothetical protein FOQG_18143 [Fusarium oxysporum f. sp. raphani 54005]|uniref:Uncharacterized protein n=3 Tax=Fusarium oxysporum TaxID=5507 RepID=X0BE93_FUSOX|nr:hypothetical protein FOVG_18102 [Fusarium oxysporum f. sp. pisi HDV247]EXK77138.1 hypothetical protein FOQG_18143 [Fusarium oxysporum f. sp. raphani 54005]EXL64285.1 hypothetical protein FOPG_19448 [Fusarium oxysporum f. sp. conglutinans race 2 54008]
MAFRSGHQARPMRCEPFLTLSQSTRGVVIHLTIGMLAKGGQFLQK